MDTFAIGIDLGTTNTCLGVMKNNQVNIIPMSGTSRTIPSIVCFSDNGKLVGEEAINMTPLHPESTIYDIKRILGRKFNDKFTQDQIKQWPFQVVNKHGNPAVQISQNGSTAHYHPEEISALVLAKAKKHAEDYLGCPVTRAVITVPAYFNNSQRNATRNAAEIAGLNVMGLITEPTAAAIAYGWENKSDIRRTALVFDLGGGTFDVSIVNIEESEYEVKATEGDTHLGGSDFDTTMVDFFAQQFHEKHGKDLKEDKSAMRRLRSKCEEIKQKLSTSFKESINLPSIHDGKDLESTISRIEFESINYPLFQRTIELVATCLAGANLTKSDITDIVLVGGSTRIPKIQEMLMDFFGGKELRKSINPDEAVAFGAAIKAAWLHGDKSDVPVGFKISDITSLSIGVQVLGGMFDVVIKRNTPIPCTVIRNNYTTAQDDQSIIRTSIYEGERLVAKENTLLGELVIANLPPRPAGELTFTYTFKLDCDGVLQVDAVRHGTGQSDNITIQLQENRLSTEEIQRIIRKGEESRKEDEKRVRLLEAEYQLENYCLSTRTKAKRLISELGSEKVAQIVARCNDGLEKMPSLKDCLAIENVFLEIKAVCQPLLDS